MDFIYVEVCSHYLKMNYLSVQNTFTKQHSNPFFFSETPSKKTFVMESQQNQITDNANQTNCFQSKTLKEIWSQHNFELKDKSSPLLTAAENKMTWMGHKPEAIPIKPIELSQKPEFKQEVEEFQQNEKIDKEDSPSHHARRPPNAFLIFCKKHRPIVRERFPNLENRGVTKILGEWWALLNNNQKQPYNDLAKEYKDAFLSANPNFRWYKLPAPPLRTLTTRPLSLTKNAVPLSSPTSPLSTEFNLGKLADESQLGGLTSLMNNNYTTAHRKEDEDFIEDSKLKEKKHSLEVSEIAVNRFSLHPKPIKKRFMELYTGDIKYSNFFDVEQKEIKGQDESGNLTNQDLMNKVVDGMFAKHNFDSSDKSSLKETRKSDRICKGKRYEMFMLEGKLLGNKRETKYHKTPKIYTKLESELNVVNNNNINNNNNIIRKNETPKLDLSDTIKRLAERTNIKIDSQIKLDCKEQPDQNDTSLIRSISKTLITSEISPKEESQKSSTPSFNLDLRISNLPSLSYDEFVQRKRESKKRKIRVKIEESTKQKNEKMDTESLLIGSKKRKNKHNITHLGKKQDNLNNELIGLATLAEVAANTQKINEEFSSD